MINRSGGRCDEPNGDFMIPNETTPAVITPAIVLLGEKLAQARPFTSRCVPRRTPSSRSAT